jgi:hypothetical protein
MKNCHANTVSPSCTWIDQFARKYSSILGFVLLLLPKCPLCVVAYSSAVTLCGTSTLVTHTANHRDWGAYVALSMCICITTCILLANRTKQSIQAALIMAISGTLLVAAGIWLANIWVLYYAGAAFLLLATLIFGGLFHSLWGRFRISFQV